MLLLQTPSQNTSTDANFPNPSLDLAVLQATLGAAFVKPDALVRDVVIGFTLLE